jgi:hypothetical protein
VKVRRQALRGKRVPLRPAADDPAPQLLDRDRTDGDLTLGQMAVAGNLAMAGFVRQKGTHSRSQLHHFLPESTLPESTHITSSAAGTRYSSAP